MAGEVAHSGATGVGPSQKGIEIDRSNFRRNANMKGLLSYYYKSMSSCTTTLFSHHRLFFSLLSQVNPTLSIQNGHR